MNKEHLDLLLNFNKRLKENIKKYIEIFVSYYGEEERSYIEEVFTNANLIGYYSDIEIMRANSKLLEAENNRLIEDLLKSTTLPVTKEMLFKIMK